MRNHPQPNNRASFRLIAISPHFSILRAWVNVSTEGTGLIIYPDPGSRPCEAQTLLQLINRQGLLQSVQHCTADETVFT